MIISNIHYYLLLSTILSSSFFPRILYSQEKDSSITRQHLSLEELRDLQIVTASKRNESFDLAPSTIYVVTEQDIIDNGYYNLTDVLENIPGVVPINLGFFAFGGQRGFLGNFSQTLLLINGREMQNLIAAETFISHQFSTHNIKQVEVIQGPGSALYGANAFVGVINIITKNSDPKYDAIEYQVEIGSENTKSHSIVFGKNIKDFRISGSFRYFESDMWNFSNFIGDTVNFSDGFPPPTRIPNLEYRNSSNSLPISIKLDYKKLYIGSESYRIESSKGLENVSLDYRSQFDSRNFDLYYLGWSPTINDQLNFDIELQYYNESFFGRNYFLNTAAYDTLLANGRDSISPFTKQEINDNFMQSYSQKESPGSKRYKANIQSNYTTNKLSIVGGYVLDMLDIRGVALSTTSLVPSFNDNRSDDNPLRRPYFRSIKNSVFLQVKKTILLNTLHTTFGSRFDYHDIYGEIFTLRGGIIYNPFYKFYLKLLYGEAFREPNVFETGASGFVNTSLGPAKMKTTEISINYSFTPNIKTNIVGYKNDATDAIVPTRTAAFSNSTDNKIVYGIESQIFIKTRKFISELGYSYVQSGNEEYFGEKISNLGVYEHRTSLGLTYDITKMIHINTRINYYNEIQAKHGNSAIQEVITIPSYTKVNATISLNKIKYSEVNLTAMLTITNVLNGTFFQPNVRTGGPKQFLQPGRQLIARLVFKF